MSSQTLDIKLGLTGVQAVKTGLQDVANRVKSITTSVSKMAVGFAGLGGVLSVGGLVAGIKSVADLSGDLSDIASRTGLASGEVLLLQQAFKLAGMEVGTLEPAIGRLNRSIAEGIDGNRTYSNAFDKIGLSAKELMKLPAQERFLAVGSAIAKLDNVVDQTQVSMQLFSRQGQSLLTLFKDASIIEKAKNNIGNLGTIMSRNSGIFDEISDSFDSLKLKSTQFFAGLLDLTEPTVRAILNKFNSADFTGMGRNIGAAFNVALEMIREGQLARLVELSFKSGLSKIPGMWSSISSFIGDSLLETIEYTVTSCFVQSGKMLTDFLNLAGSQIATWGLALGLYISNNIRSQIDRVLAKIPGMGALGFTPESSKAWATSFDDAVSTSYSIVGDNFLGLEGVSEWLDDTQKGLDANLKVELGIDTSDWDAEFSTFVEKTKRIADEKIAAGGIKNAVLTGVSETSEEDNPEKKIRESKKAINDLTQEQLEKENEISQISTQRAIAEKNWTWNNVRKYEEKIELLNDEENKLKEIAVLYANQNIKLDDQIKIKNDLLKQETNEKEKEKLEDEIIKLENEKKANERKIKSIGWKISLNQGTIEANPEKINEQIKKNLIELENSFGTFEENVGEMFTNVGNTMSSSLSTCFFDIIKGTKTAGDAFKALGQSIVDSMLKAVTDTIAAFIMRNTVCLALNAIFGETVVAQNAATNAATIAQDTAAAAEETTIWTFPAVLKSIATWGGAALIGAAILMSVLASFGGFAEGGRVEGPMQLAWFNEQGSEFVVSAKSPRSNDRYLEMANRGINLDTLFRAIPARELRESDGSQVVTGGGNSKVLMIRTQSELREEWKRGGVVDYVRSEFKKRGWS